MRQDMTNAEKLLWQRLRRNQLLGLHFRRQQIIAGFIADFYCHQIALAVEVDGATHDPDYDAQRDAAFAQRGIKTLRFWNNEVTQSIDGVMARITTEATEKMRPAFRVRQAEWADVEALHALTQAAYAEYAGTATPSMATAETLRDVREKFWAGNFRAVVVEADGGKIVGAARFRVDSDGLYFFRLCVHPEFRGHGIARKLLGWLEEEGERWRARKLRCQVRLIVPRNVALYRNAGFEVVSEHTVVRGGNEVPVATMEKRLPEDK
jgi:very-short-patch-repair endonuclease/predicted N-acetyltransferase YhbS